MAHFTCRFPAHSALVFFVFAIVGHTIYLLSYRKVSQDGAWSEKRDWRWVWVFFLTPSSRPSPASSTKGSVTFKTVILAIIWLLFLLYIPIGLPLAESTYVEVRLVSGCGGVVALRP